MQVQAYKNALLKILSPGVQVSCLIVNVFHGGTPGREHAEVLEVRPPRPASKAVLRHRPDWSKVKYTRFGTKPQNSTRKQSLQKYAA